MPGRGVGSDVRTPSGRGGIRGSSGSSRGGRGGGGRSGHIIRSPSDSQPVKLRSRSTGAGSTGSPNAVYVNAAAVSAALGHVSAGSGGSASSSRSSSPATSSPATSSPRTARPAASSTSSSSLHKDGASELYANADAILEQERRKHGYIPGGGDVEPSEESEIAKAIRTEKFAEVRQENQMLKQALASAQIALYGTSAILMDGSNASASASSGVPGTTDFISTLSVRSNSRRRSFEVPIEVVP